jgi:ParB-like chromosome segregation protein Spo0J
MKTNGVSAMPKETYETLLLEKIRINGGTQMRVEIDEDTVADYSFILEALESPIVIFDGTDYWLADGFHRYHAHRKAGRKSMKCQVQQGTRRDAILLAAGANSTHGLRRTNADKRKAVAELLKDEEWIKWSDRKISQWCFVSHGFVAEVRKSISLDTESSDNRVFESRSGKPVEMDTARITASNKKRAKKKEAAESNGRHAPEMKPEPTPEPEPADPMEAAQEWLKAYAGRLEGMAREFDEWADRDTEKRHFTAKYAHYFSPAGTSDLIRQVKRGILQDMPGEAIDKSPGYISVRLSKAREAVKR